MPLNVLSVPLLAIGTVLPALAGQQISEAASQVDVVSIKEDNYNRMTVPVRLGEKGSYHFLIDTGSQNTVLSAALAGRLALERRSKVKLIGVAGVQEVDTVTLDELGLGRRSYYSLLAPLLAREDIGADGILGLDSLQGQRVQIDFRKGLMAVDDARALGGNRGYEIIVTARRKSGQLIMANALIDGVKVDVVVDTGAEYSIGNRALQKRLARFHRSGTIALKSVTGQVIMAELGLAKDLLIDKMNFGNVVIAYANSPAFKALDLEARPALFLGMRDMRALDRLAVDFSTRRIYFDVPIEAYRP